MMPRSARRTSTSPYRTALRLLPILPLVPILAHAGEFKVLGPDALSLGGAGVARARGAYAAYYNPGALGFAPDIARVAVSADAAFRDVGAGKHLDRLADLDWDEAVDDPLGSEAAAVIAEILRIPNDAGLLLGPGGACAVQVKSFGTGLFLTSEAASYASIDTTRTAQSPPSDPNSFANNESTLFLRGIAIAEVPFAYGHRLNLAKHGMLGLGAAIKLMYGATYENAALVTEIEEITEDYEQFEEESYALGLDLGALYHLPELPLAVGLVLRNVNAPEFDLHTGGTHTEELQARAGLDWELIPAILSLAADLDVTENETVLRGYKSRMLGAGLDWHPVTWFAARLGLMYNLAAATGARNGPVVTGGLAFGFRKLHANIAAAAGLQEGEFDGQDYRSEMRVSAALGSYW